MISYPAWRAMFLNISMVHPVCLILSSSFIVSSFSPHALSNHRYKKRGSRCIKGRCEMILPRAICWCPPNGICQAGKATNSAPPGDKYSFKPDRKRTLCPMCSITSCIRMRGKVFSKSFSWKISEAMKTAFWFLSAKKVRACCIREVAISTPTTSHPDSAKGSRLPASPHPTSNTLAGRCPILFFIHGI